MSSLKYWLWLSACPGIGLARKKNLLEYFGSPENIHAAGNDDYLDIEGIKSSDILNLTNKDLSNANEIISSCAKAGCRIVTFGDSDYPERLRNIYDPPMVLYVKGSLPYIDDEPVVGVVGTRKCTVYGYKIAEKTGYKLSKYGIIVVTGLASGIDSAASKGALKGGKATIGIIGCGLDVIYPYENKKLFEYVTHYGAIISEYPPGTEPNKFNFPARNRLISGISLGVAVIEAPVKSGALITARNATEQGRDVFSLPGNVGVASNEGSNNLLREGAIPFISVEDIIDQYIDLYPDKINISNIKNTSGKDEINNIYRGTEQKKPIDNESKVDYIDLGILLERLSGDEKTIAMTIGRNTVDTDDIIINTGFPAPKVLASLTMLEINGYIRQEQGGNWKLINRKNINHAIKKTV